jgi:hypothetical protein
MQLDRTWDRMRHRPIRRRHVAFIEALRDRQDHPWIGDRRDEVLANFHARRSR